MDDSEAIGLSDGLAVSWNRLVDQYTGEVLRTTLFPRGRWPQVGGAAVQADLSDDGLPPERVRWLIGLGVSVVWNPPYRPQANGVVERSQGVAKAWAEPHTAADARELQQRLDRFDRMQRDEYPYGPDRRPRSAVVPGLAHSGRAYDPALWDLTRVLDHLSGYVVRRKVDPQGKIRVHNNQRHVGRDRIGQLVWVSLAPVERRWAVADGAGREYRRVDATERTTEAVRGLAMVYRSRPARPRRPTRSYSTARTPTDQSPPRCRQSFRPTSAAEPDVAIAGGTWCRDSRRNLASRDT